MKPREFWIRPEGISKPCVYHAAVYTEQDLAAEGGTNEFIQAGINVIEKSAYDELFEQVMKWRESLLALKLAIASEGHRWGGFKLSVPLEKRFSDMVSELDNWRNSNEQTKSKSD